MNKQPTSDGRYGWAAGAVIAGHAALVSPLVVFLALVPPAGLGQLGIVGASLPWAVQQLIRSSSLWMDHLVVAVMGLAMLLALDAWAWMSIAARKGQKAASIYAIVVTLALSLIFLWYIAITADALRAVGEYRLR